MGVQIEPEYAHGIEVPTTLFPDSWNMQNNQVKLEWPVPVLLVIDCIMDLDLNSSRTQIIMSEKWLRFEEKLFAAILAGIKQQADSDYWQKVEAILIKKPVSAHIPKPVDVEEEPDISAQPIKSAIASKQTDNGILNDGSGASNFNFIHGQVFNDTLKDGSPAPKMVWLQGGSFTIGSPESEEQRNNDEGQKLITLESFAIGLYPVTFEEYDVYVNTTKARVPDDEGWGYGKRPVINVNWLEAMAYCAWLSEQTGENYCLPTEAQWEYACRAGTTTPFSCGETIFTDLANYDGEFAHDFVYQSDKKGVFRGQTIPVGTFPVNPWGLYDMHGNVSEWTASLYEKNYHGQEIQISSQKDTIMLRALRGGSWGGVPASLRSADRSSSIPKDRDSSVGFRLARTR